MPVAPYERCHAPRFDLGDIRYIDSELVHAYFADNGCFLPTNQHAAVFAGQIPRNAVGISERQNGDNAVPLCRERAVIANTLALPDLAEQNDSCFK